MDLDWSLSRNPVIETSENKITLSLPNPPIGMRSRLPGVTGWHANILVPVMNGSLCGPEMPPCPPMSLFGGLPHHWSHFLGFIFFIMSEHVGGSRSSRCRVPREPLLVEISGAFYQRVGFGAYTGAGESSSN